MAYPIEKRSRGAPCAAAIDPMTKTGIPFSNHQTHACEKCANPGGCTDHDGSCGITA